jgi:hypothetical protein
MVGPLEVISAGPSAATIKVEDVDDGPAGGAADRSDSGHHRSPSGIYEVPELKVQERSACGARSSGRAVNDCRNLGTNAQRVVRTHFTLTQVGYFF